MKQYLVITIDVEPDCSPDWTYSSPLTFKGVSEGIANRLQPLFNRFDITPTYLINNVVLEDDKSIGVFKTLQGKFELGTHLHPEFISPEKEFEQYAGKKGEANCCFYSPEIEFEKIKNISELFIKKFGYAPTSFRAGRFSAGANTIESLIKLGYKVDTSVTPNIKWNDRTREKPVDFRSAPLQPYRIAEKSIIAPDQKGKLLEVPVSIINEKLSVPGLIKYIVKKKRFPYKGSEAKWLRPVFSDYNQFIRIVEKVREQNSGDIKVYNMMFHNVEVMPALSPYTLTEKDCSNYLESLERFFTYCKQNNIQSIGLSALYERI